ARLRAAGQGQLLVDHSQYAPAGGLNRHDRAVHVAKGLDGGGSNRWVFAASVIAIGNVAGKRAHREALIITPVMPAARIARSRRAAPRQTRHALLGTLILANL